LNENLDFKDLIRNPLKISQLKYDDIDVILHEIIQILSEESVLLKFSPIPSEDEIFIIGDIHGNLKSLNDLIQIVKRKNPELVIFLGDIVDRGPYQLECLVTVMILKIMEPKKYHILRGNHETLEMNAYYGFLEVFNNKFGNTEQFSQIISFYSLLPYCAVVNDQILCLHGGIPEDFEILSKFKGKKVIDIPSFSKDLANSMMQIIWNDPKEGLKGFSESYRGPGIKFFGEDVFSQFMERYQLRYLIRSHEVFEEGYKWFFNKRLLSIFSSANYRGSFSPNPASYAVIKDNYVVPKFL
jgi:diadenosine tetraphosphatase ApaH/serine/threonine PP2A family protein phosphatase